MGRFKYAALLVVVPTSSPAARAGGVEHVKLVASWPLVIQINLAVIPFSHRSLFLWYAGPSKVPAGCLLGG